jgi:hypothetical protein
VTSVRECAAVLDLLGLIIFMTTVGIGLLDLRSGLGPFATYRSVAIPDVGRPAATGRRGDDNHPTPPAPAL